MVDPILYLAFLPTVAILVITPGPDMLFAMAQGLRGGRRAALGAAAGISCGALVNSALAGAGLGMLVATVPWVFGVVKWVGIAYLLWLAMKTLLTPMDLSGAQHARAGRAFRDGLIVSVSNPQVVLFILALIPQFVDPALPVFPQFLIFGATIAALGFFVKASVGLSAGGFGQRFARDARITRILRWITAGLFGGLALRLAVSGAR